jgi:Na+/melibiose symporter-like transporter
MSPIPWKTGRDFLFPLQQENLLNVQEFPLPARVKCLYGIGDVALVVKGQMIGLFTLYLYTSVMGLSGTVVGVISALGLLWDAAIDPYIGYRSDRCRAGLGRRHLFMLFGALTMGASFWAYFAPPPALSPTHLVLWFLAANLLLRTTTSLFGVPYYALGAELSQDYHERTSVTGIRSAWALTGTLCAAVLSFVVFFPNTQEGVDPKLDYEAYPAMGLSFALLMTVVSLVSVFGTFERRNLQPPAPPDPETFPHRGFLTSFLLSLQNPAFRCVFFSYSLFFLGVVSNALLANHYFTYYVDILDSKRISAFHLCFYACALVSVPLWLWAARSVEKKALYLVALLGMTTLLVCAWALFGAGSLFGTGNALPLIIGNGVAGCLASILWIIPPSMIADITDLDTQQTGERREGSFFGLFFFGQQIATGIALLLVGLLVDRFAGLVPGQALQSEETAARIGILFGLLPAACLVAGTALILFYRLNKTRVLLVQSKWQGPGEPGEGATRQN